MKMKTLRTLCGVLVVVSFIFCGCTQQSVRYTNDEIKDFPADIQAKIIKGEISLGMTPKQVRYAWGPPESVRFLDRLDGKTREEWTYSKMAVWETRKLLFIDGKLVYIMPEPENVKDSEKAAEPEKVRAPEKAAEPEKGKGSERPAEREKIQETIPLQEMEKK